MTESTLDRRFTTPAILDQEEAIVAAVERRVAEPGHPTRVHAPWLDPGQQRVAAAVAGTKQLVLVVGPAGAGKTSALGVAVTQLRMDRRPVLGLAPSASAAGVLAEECRLPADTVEKLLHDHRTGRNQPPPPGTTVIVDEAGMLSTPKLAELIALADRQAWRLVLVGDPLQLSAVGRGGMFAHLVDAYDRVELERVHRFRERWEREESLRLRAGKPEALDAYDRHGRLHAGPAAEQEAAVVDRWDELRRSSDVAVLCATNETARRFNGVMQQRRRQAGELSDVAMSLARGQMVHVGDVVASRQNDRTLRTTCGHMVKNRARWTVEAIARDGTLRVAGADGTVELPLGYVVRAVELAYAETIHAAQGRTVDHSILLIDGPIDSHAIYVALTRGRHTNHAHVVTDCTGMTATDALGQALTRYWVDSPATEASLRVRW